MKMKLPLPVAPPRKQNKQQVGLNLNKKLDAASKAFRAALAKNDYELAYKEILIAYKLMPSHPNILMDMAYTELRLGRYEKSFNRYLKAIEASPGKVDTNIYDGLAEVAHFLKDDENLAKYGGLAIETKKQQVAQQPLVAQINTPAPTFNPNNPQENIIAYSLFGGLPRYCETSIINIDLAKEIYPEWICRFYVDESVPQSIRDRLKEKGAQVVMVSEEQKKLSGLFWRFFVMDDPTVNCFLVRDADSLVSYRERAAVDEWLQSKKWFHCMHDFYSHTELILAGMWGGFNGVFKNIEQHIENYIKTGNYLNQRVMDQHYLRFCIWPTVQQSVLLHDSQGFDPASLPFPAYQKQTDFEDLSEFHVGMNEGSSQVYADVTQPNAKYVEWTLTNEANVEVCRYEADVLKDHKILVELPRTYARKLESKEWKLHTYLAEKGD